MTSITSPVNDRAEPAGAGHGLDSRRLLLLGWWFIAVPMVGFGLQQLLLGRFVTRLTPGFSSGTPAPVALVYGVSLAIAAAGVALLVGRRRVRTIAILFGAAILLSFLVMHLPRLIAMPQDRIAWLRALKGLTLASGAFVMAATARQLGRVSGGGGRHEFISDRALFSGACAVNGIYLVYCGYLHLSDPGGVARLVPAWIPAKVAWAKFTGVALALGGAGFWLPPLRRIAAALSSLMIFLWVVLLHLPAAVASSGFGSNATVATFEALAFCGLALIVATADRTPNQGASHEPA
jgi:uncharacterized membrane protein